MKVQPFVMIIIVLMVGALSATAQTDQKQIDSLVQEMYTRLSFTDGQWKQAEAVSGVFFRDSRLIANFGAKPITWTVAEYISATRENITKQGISSLTEKELFQKTEIFGKVAQRLSTYEVKFAFKDREQTRTGINLIQFIKVDGKWLVNSIIWDRESADLKVPTEFRPAR